MAHYALIDENNAVVQVITGRDESNFDWEQYYSFKHGMVCKRTSYNTYGGVHQTGGTAFRKNFAAIGHTFDDSKDAFIPDKPYPSWVLNETTCRYEAPSAYPTDGNVYYWDEDSTNWVQGD